MTLKILNETVYDSDDIRNLLFWLRDTGAPLANAAWKAQHELYEHNRAQRDPTYMRRPFSDYPPHPLGWEALRVGYYAGGKHDDDSPKWVSWSHPYGKAPRLGIVKHTKLPLVPMEVIAHAAADKDQRTLPRETFVDLIRELMGVMGYGIVEDAAETLADEAPRIRYAFKVDKASAKASKHRADKDALKRAKQTAGYMEREVEGLEEKLAERRAKLLKLRTRIIKLGARINKRERAKQVKQPKRMEAVCD